MHLYFVFAPKIVISSRPIRWRIRWFCGQTFGLSQSRWVKFCQWNFGNHWMKIQLKRHWNRNCSIKAITLKNYKSFSWDWFKFVWWEWIRCYRPNASFSLNIPRSSMYWMGRSSWQKSYSKVLYSIYWSAW